jgi:hypothetical protein
MWAAAVDPSTPGLADCERIADGLLAQPVNTVSSVAYVAVGLVIAVLATTRHRGWRARSLVLAACLVATGLGSVAYHGPQPAVAELLHDLPIALLLGLVALHDLQLLVPRFRRVIPTVIVGGLVVAGLSLVVPVVASLAADALVVAVIVAEVAIHRRRLRPRPSPRQQRRLLFAMTLAVVVAGALFVLGRSGGPLCDPESVVQLHAAWHVVSAAAVGLWWWLALASEEGDETDRAGTDRATNDPRERTRLAAAAPATATPDGPAGPRSN